MELGIILISVFAVGILLWLLPILIKIEEGEW